MCATHKGMLKRQMPFKSLRAQPLPPTSLGGRVEVARKSHYRRLLRPCPCLFVCALLRRRVAWCITSHWRLKDNVVVEFVLHTCVGSGLQVRQPSPGVAAHRPSAAARGVVRAYHARRDQGGPALHARPTSYPQGVLLPRANQPRRAPATRRRVAIRTESAEARARRGGTRRLYRLFQRQHSDTRRAARRA